MSPEASLLARIDAYIEDLFVPADEALGRNLAAAAAAGLPAISVSPNQGKLLALLVKMSRAGRILEIGTLGGYSTTWLARALPPGGIVVSLELDPRHAEVARRSIAGAAAEARVDIRVGPAAAALRAMIAGREEPFDFVFIDADKTGYRDYLELALQLSRPGTVIVADNVIRNGAVLEPAPGDEAARAIRTFNASLAAHPRLDAIIVPLLRGEVDGIAIAVVL